MNPYPWNDLMEMARYSPETRPVIIALASIHEALEAVHTELVKMNVTVDAIERDR